jgi:hypothetical protein
MHEHESKVERDQSMLAVARARWIETCRGSRIGCNSQDAQAARLPLQHRSAFATMH